MANTILTPVVVAKEALRILDNNLVMGKMVHRAYEDEFSKEVNGYSVGDTISVRRPTDFTVRDGRTASIQDVTEGKFPIVVDKQKGIDFNFTSKDLSLSLDKSDVSERVIKPAMVQLANQLDRDLMALYAHLYNWVGTPGETINSFADFAKGPERLDFGAVPQDQRSAVLSPADWWAMAGSQTALYLQTIAGQAYKEGEIGRIGNLGTAMSQNVATHTNGSFATVQKAEGSQSTTYSATLNSNTMSLAVNGAAVTSTFKAGDVFTIGSVFAVNPVTKATQAHLQQFVVVADATGSAITTSTTLTISPPIITTGAFQTVSAAPANSATLTFLGTAGTGYLQNMMFHKNAFALIMVPMVVPPGAVSPARESYKGTSVRVIPYYDGVSDVSNWRLDMLYGVKALDRRLATRISGTG